MCASNHFFLNEGHFHARAETFVRNNTYIILLLEILLFIICGVLLLFFFFSDRIFEIGILDIFGFEEFQRNTFEQVNSFVFLNSL